MARCTYQRDGRDQTTRCTRPAAPGLRCCATHDAEMEAAYEARGLVWDGRVEADTTIAGHQARQGHASGHDTAE